MFFTEFNPMSAAEVAEKLQKVNIAGATVEESLKGVDIAILLHHDTVEGNAGNLQLSCQLREHHILAPRHCTIGTAVECLHLKTLLLRKIHFLRMEPLQIRHLSLELR